MKETIKLKPKNPDELTREIAILEAKIIERDIIIQKLAKKEELSTGQYITYLQIIGAFDEKEN